jgi:hypothetical protein
MESERGVSDVLALTPLEAADVLFELVLTSREARDRARAIARARIRHRARPEARRERATCPCEAGLTLPRRRRDGGEGGMGDPSREDPPTARRRP